MKRCPKCEFIYEDDQSLCDMDGVCLSSILGHCPTPRPPDRAAAKRTPKRNRAVPAFATLILALVLGMVYYVSVQRKANKTATSHTAAERCEHVEPGSPRRVPTT